MASARDTSLPPHHGYGAYFRVRHHEMDALGHVNNAVYYHFFDSIVNTYLITHCGLAPTASPLIGLVVTSFCHFFAPLSFPTVLELGLRVDSLGTSSVAYEIAVFEEGEEAPSAVGGYTHVFVESTSRKSARRAAQAITSALATTLRVVYVSPSSSVSSAASAART